MINKTRWFAPVVIAIILTSLTSSQIPQANAVTFGALGPTTGTVGVPVQFNAASLAPGVGQSRPITVYFEFAATPGAPTGTEANNGAWDLGEGAVYSTDNDYAMGEPVVVGQTVSTPEGPISIIPDPLTHLKNDPRVKYVDDTPTNGVWNADESVILDADDSGTFTAGDIVIAGATPAVGTALSTDSGLKFIDGEASCATTATGSFCSALWTFSATGTFDMRAVAVDNTGLGPVVLTRQPVIANAPPIFIDPPSFDSVFPGSSLDYVVNVGTPGTAPVTDLDTWEVTVLYDPSVITAVGLGPTRIPCGPSPACTTADYGATAPFTAYTVLRTPTLDDTIGTVIVGGTFFAFPTVGPTGAGTLVQVDFNGDGPGAASTAIHFQDIKLRSVTSTQTISLINVVTPSTVTDGSATVSGTLDFSPITAPLNQAQTFTASATGGTPPYTFDWDFTGDFVPDASGLTATWTFTNEGDFPVALLITDSTTTPNTGIIVKTVTVGQPPVLTVPGPQSVPVGSPLSFDVSALDPDAEQTVTIACTQCSSIGASFTTTPGNPATGTFAWTPTATDVGTHTFTFVATDNGTPQFTATKSVDVTVVVVGSPSASFTFAPSPAAVGESVSFDGTASTDPDGTIDSYSWDFGDSDCTPQPSCNTATTVTATHTYLNTGTYTVKLTVTDNNGLTGFTTKDITIVPQLQTTVSAAPTQGSPPLTVSLAAQPSGGSPPYTYTWNFGDGTPSSSEQNPSHTYQSQGLFQATVTVTDSQGRTAQGSTTITVTKPPTTTLRISVTDAQDNALEGATVRLISLPPGQSNPGPKSTGADGSVIFDNLLGGDYTFEVSITGYQSVSQTVTVQLGGYDNQASASLSEVARAPPAPINYTPYIIGGVVAFLIGLGLYLRGRSPSPRPRAQAAPK